MIECGSVRWPLTRTRPIGFSSTGTSPTGIHHASRMFVIIAPALIAMSKPSPVLVSIETGCVIGPRRKARRSSSFHSNPPDASTTPFVAATSIGPSGVSTTTPTTAPSSRQQLPPRAGGARLDAAVQARPEEATGERLTAAPLVADAPSLVLLGRRRLRHGLAERCLAHGDVRVGEVRRRREPVRPLAELVERVDRALQGAPAPGAPARELGVVVGHARDGVELHRRLGLEQLDHLRAGVDVGLDEAWLEHVHATAT